jgi:hypothetical protein
VRCQVSKTFYRTPRSHPSLVVLVAGEDKSHALIMLEDAQTITMTLEKAVNEDLKAPSHSAEMTTRHVRSRGIRQVPVAEACPTDVYRELWNLVMFPIVRALGWPVSLTVQGLSGCLVFVQKAQGRDRRRLTLCPTGIFMQLPPHAAGIYTGDHQISCSDYFVSTYVPSVGALLHIQQIFKPIRRVSVDTLIMAVEQPFEGQALPLISEANTVRHHVPQSAKVVEVSKSVDVSEQIWSAPILHMACHGT